ncbi:MAG: PKD domain-containing protein [Saprospiraceae bacterium]|nr:PKD domain-containing protein [Saprospiraceae bacterium]
MNILRLCSLIFFFFKLQTSDAQAVQISGTINHYAAVTAIDSCSGKLTVSDTTGFRAGAPVLLIQMQGTEIVSGNNFLYGLIQNMNFAGRYERAVIDSVSENALFVQKKLVYAYSLPGKLQAVTIPQYTNALVTDTLRCQPWNGATGGVLALEVAGTLTIDAPIVADGAGFRGGAAYVGAGNNCNFLFPELNYFYPFPNWRGGYKGEGIALPEPGKELGRGPQANGGGGGNDHNSGGGGGANITDGGNGGDNDEPSALGCDGYYPGIRGYAPPFTTNRMFLGGGGGAGHSNNTLFSAGANGGGIILIEAGDIVGANPLISANGLSAALAQGDGAGGGGAGGTIWLKTNAAPANLVVRANGGNGGNTFNNNSNRCFGPGGGGSGGRILANLPGLSAPTGGQAGIVAASTNGCNGTTRGASAGEAGLVENLPAMPAGTANHTLPQVLASPAPDSVCPGDVATFVVEANNGNWAFQWQVNDGTGWQDIADAAQYAGFQTPSLAVLSVVAGQNGWQFRCRVLRAGCYEVVSSEANLWVNPVPNADFSFSQNGATIDFSNQSSATSFFWKFGDGNTSQQEDPQHTYASEGTYTVTLYAITDCDTATATQTLDVLLPPIADFTFPLSTTGCGAATVPFSNASSANVTALLWSFPGGTPASSTLPNPFVSYTTTGVYTATLIVSNAAGQDTLTQLVVVTVNPLPIADFVFFVQPDGSVQFADQSQYAANRLWDFGDNTISSQQNPAHAYTTEGTYTVTLTVWNVCDTVAMQQTLTVALPPVAGFWVQDTTLGCLTAAVDFENTSSANVANFVWEFPGGNPAASTAPNPTVEYLTSGSYTARLIASNGVGADTAEQTFAVQVFGFPTANFSYTFLPGGVVRFTNLSQSAATYTWDFGDGSPFVNGTNIDHAYAASGVYTVTLIATSPCGVSLLQQTIEVVVSGVAVSTPQGLGSIRLYPNPTSDWLTVDCSEAAAQPVGIQVFDASGQFLLEQREPLGWVSRCSFERFPAGVYRVVVWFECGMLARAVVKNGG